MRAVVNLVADKIQNYFDSSWEYRIGINWSLEKFSNPSDSKSLNVTFSFVVSINFFGKLFCCSNLSSQHSNRLAQNIQILFTLVWRGNHIFKFGKGLSNLLFKCLDALSERICETGTLFRQALQVIYMLKIFQFEKQPYCQSRFSQGGPQSL